MQLLNKTSLGPVARLLKGLVLKPSFSFHKVEKNGGTLVEASDGLYYICYSTVTSKVLLNRPQNKPGQQFDASYLDKYYYYGALK